VQRQSKLCIFAPEDMALLETKFIEKRRWDKRNRLKEIIQKPTILTMIVIRNLEIVPIHEEKRWSFKMHSK